MITQHDDAAPLAAQQARIPAGPLPDPVIRRIRPADQCVWDWPESALGILSALPVSDLVLAIQSGDVGKLETVPGVGKKTAGRIVLELKEKAAKLQPAMALTSDVSFSRQDTTFDDALSALTNLKYRAQDAKDALKRVRKSKAEAVSLQALIRETLKDLARG